MAQRNIIEEASQKLLKVRKLSDLPAALVDFVTEIEDEIADGDSIKYAVEIEAESLEDMIDLTKKFTRDIWDADQQGALIDNFEPRFFNAAEDSLREMLIDYIVTIALYTHMDRSVSYKLQDIIKKADY